MTARWTEHLSASLASLDRAERRRRLQPTRREAGLVDLTHNDYLGLRFDEVWQERVRRRIERLPAGAGGSRLLGGEHPVYAELEERFAALKGCEAALYLPSGYAANEAVSTALGKLPDVAFFSDALNHASIIDGLRLCALPRERRSIFRHNDAAHLAELLAESRASTKVVYTESVFSMDGDMAPLAKLGELVRQHGGVLVVDEAHAILCYGERGRGLSARSALGDDGLVTVNTCGKAMGAQGALIGCSRLFRDYLINTARPFIYTTGPSPWMAAALLEVLDYEPVLDERRETLASHAAALGSATHIVPVHCGSDGAALAAERRLAERGILARAIRPPTVPEGTARLRLSLSSALRTDEVARVVEALRG